MNFPQGESILGRFKDIFDQGSLFHEWRNILKMIDQPRCKGSEPNHELLCIGPAKDPDRIVELVQ